LKALSDSFNLLQIRDYAKSWTGWDCNFHLINLNFQFSLNLQELTLHFR